MQLKFENSKKRLPLDLTRLQNVIQFGVTTLALIQKVDRKIEQLAVLLSLTLQSNYGVSKNNVLPTQN